MYKDLQQQKERKKEREEASWLLEEMYNVLTWGGRIHPCFEISPPVAQSYLLCRQVAAALPSCAHLFSTLRKLVVVLGFKNSANLCHLEDSFLRNLGGSLSLEGRRSALEPLEYSLFEWGPRHGARLEDVTLDRKDYCRKGSISPGMRSIHEKKGWLSQLNWPVTRAITSGWTALVESSLT